MEASGAILLSLSTLVAMIFANSPWAGSYHALWERMLTVGVGPLSLSQSYHDWINDGLMSLFFFLMGLEIKRELLIGELSSFKSAAFPFVAALGGSCVPMLVYLLLAPGGDAQRGWAVPMATDIAFALGVLALLGKRVPGTLKIFVTALAIVDDVFAVLIIAVFFTAHISILSVGLTLVGLAASCLANWLGIRKPAVYAVIGVFVWLAVLKSGIHATIAGVLMALTIPASTSADRSLFVRSSRFQLDEIEAAPRHSAEEHDAFRALERESQLMQSPLHRIEHGIQPWVSFLIMPLFALANAGVHVLGKMSGALVNPVMLGVVCGLLLGKPLGITLFAWLAAKLNLASPPAQVHWRQIFGASWLCGIGFTMSLFIAGLAFGNGEMLDMAKIGTFSGSVLAGVAGALVLKHADPRMTLQNGFETARNSKGP
jgi:NhaA family Na+:H+ antiporter